MFQQRFLFFTSAIAIVWSLGICADASGRPHRVDDLPNGDRFDCLNCHTSSTGKSFNNMGTSALSALTGTGATSTRSIDWSLLYERDSDADGFSNGEELGDPEGAWVIGDANPGGAVTNPGDPSSHPAAFCGDGRITPPEDCEGENLNSRNCFTQGFEEGALSCNPDCSYDVSMCVGREVPAEDVSAGDAFSSSGGSSASSGGDIEEDDGDSGGCSAMTRRSGEAPLTVLLWMGIAGALIARRRARG